MNKITIIFGIICLMLAGLCLIQNRVIIKQSANVFKLTNELHLAKEARKADALAHELKDKAIREAKVYAQIQKGELASIIQSDIDDCDYVARFARMLYPEAYGHCDTDTAKGTDGNPTKAGSTSGIETKADPAKND